MGGNDPRLTTSRMEKVLSLEKTRGGPVVVRWRSRCSTPAPADLRATMWSAGGLGSFVGRWRRWNDGLTATEKEWRGELCMWRSNGGQRSKRGARKGGSNSFYSREAMVAQCEARREEAQWAAMALHAALGAGLPGWWIGELGCEARLGIVRV